MKHRKQRVCTSCPTELSNIRSLVRESCNGYGLDKMKTEQVTLAVDEACANIIRHGYKNSKEGYMCIETYEEQGFAVFVLKDRCQKISNDMLIPPDDEPLKPGGLGLALINQVMDSVELIPHEELGNHLKMKIKL